MLRRTQPRQVQVAKVDANQKSALQRWLYSRSTVFVLLLVYITMVAVFAIMSPYFFTIRNILNTGNNVAYIGLMAAPQTLLIIGGGLDLSVAAVAGFAGVLLSILVKNGVDIWIGIVVVLLVGCLVGLINGFIVTRLSINPLIATLGMLYMIEGLALVLTGGLSQPLSAPGFSFLGSGRILGIPVPLLMMLIVFMLLGWILERTRFGRFVYAVGGNASASRLAGIPVDSVLIRLYVLSGLSGALSGVLLASMLGASAPKTASGALLTVIAAVIFGGTSLAGGRGTVWGTLLAVLILGTLNNGLVLLNVSSFWQTFIQGVVLLLAVWFDQIRSRSVGE
jgi:ribose transport system permease protein